MSHTGEPPLTNGAPITWISNLPRPWNPTNQQRARHPLNALPRLFLEGKMRNVARGWECWHSPLRLGKLPGNQAPTIFRVPPIAGLERLRCCHPQTILFGAYIPIRCRLGKARQVDCCRQPDITSRCPRLLSNHSSSCHLISHFKVVIKSQHQEYLQNVRQT